MNSLISLGVGILQIIPQITTTNGNPTQYQPLAFIILVSALRAAKEDWDKHKADAKRNGHRYSVRSLCVLCFLAHLRCVQVLQASGKFEPTRSGDIRVGQIVKVLQNEMIPADMVLLGTSHAKGHCFIDKANLNGETRLEVYNSLMETRAQARRDEDLAQISFVCGAEAPNKHLETFRGSASAQGGHEFSLDAKVLLLRETILRNTDFVYGLVVYTGNDTKIQQSNSNGEKVLVKRSRIMRSVDRYLVGMLLAQIALCFIGGLIAGIDRGSDKIDKAWYLQWSLGANGFGAATTGILAFFSWFILLSQMVPISLIVSAEMVKFIQSQFLQWDIHLYYTPIDPRHTAYRLG